VGFAFIVSTALFDGIVDRPHLPFGWMMGVSTAWVGLATYTVWVIYRAIDMTASLLHAMVFDLEHGLQEQAGPSPGSRPKAR
jgi:hypothetical protein